MVVNSLIKHSNFSKKKIEKGLSKNNLIIIETRHVWGFPSPTLTLS